MVYRAKGTNIWKLRVSAPSGRQATLSTGCVDEHDAAEVETLVRRWAGDRGKRYARPDVLELLVAKAPGFTLAAAVEAHHDGRLDAMVAAAQATASATDLRPHVAPWLVAKQASRKGAKSAAKYARQVEALFAGEPMTSAAFTAPALRARRNSPARRSAPRRRGWRAAPSPA